jgi:hypothetical protein
MRSARRLAAVLVGAVLIALCAGCGSYTKADFIARADAICASTLRQTRTVPPPSFSGGGNQLSALGGYVARVLPLVRSEAGQLRSLRKPPGSARERAVLAGYLAAFARAVDEYGALAAAATRGDGQAAAIAEAALKTSPAAALAARYGLHTCGTAQATIA